MNCYINANLVFNDKIIKDGFLLEDDGKIIETGSMSSLPSGNFNKISCEGLYLSPGFIDIHTHGAGNSDFLDGTESAFVNGLGEMYILE